MQKTFSAALDHVLKYEGGYSDHPEDQGGATNHGITIAVLAQHRGRAVSKQDVRELTKNEAAQIYRIRYWDATSCALLPSGIDLAAFDCAVNQGVGRARRFLQQAARVRVDGTIGPATLAAISSANERTLLNEFMAHRMLSYGRLQRLFRTFGLGWSRRLIATHSAAVALLDTNPNTAPPYIQPTSRFSMNYIIKRLKEPSTYAGVAAFLAGFGLLGLTEQDWNQLFGAFAAIAAAMAIFIEEKSDPEQEAPKTSSINGA